MRITLTVTAGPHEGRVFTFDRHDTFIVGRSQRAHFRLRTRDRYFSRIHFLVEVNPPQCRLLDLGSRNGTYVNGAKVKATDLWDGDVIKAGKTLLRVEMVSEPAPDDARESSRLQAVPIEDGKPLPAPVPEGSGLEETPRPPAAPSSSPGGPRPRPLPGVPQHGKPPAGPHPPPGPVSESCRLCGAPLPAAARPAPAGAGRPPPLCPSCEEEVGRHAQPIPGYRVARELGRGGMGVVWLALRLADGSRVALKTITPAQAGDGEIVGRFLREAGILRELDHPRIVAFQEMGEANGQLYFAMQYVPGTDAGRVLEQEGPLSAGRAVGWVCQALEALEYAHARGFVHRDIKPANVLVTQEAGREVIKMADFGLARVYQASKLSGLTMTREMGGTPAFMAPEQILNFRDAQPAADQYGAAATLYNLLTGKHVYDLPGQVLEALAVILHDDPMPIRARRGDLPVGLADVIHRALAREPAERFPDVREMRQALQPFCS
jgi:serine/threonine-protein kinase